MRYDAFNRVRERIRSATGSPQRQAPYAAALREQTRRQRIRAQAPGHGGRALPAGFTRIARHYKWYDVSVMWGVDLPLSPKTSSPLEEAEARCAELFGARLCRFVTTGATHAAQAGALAMYEAVGRGRKIAVQASCHVSVIDALCRVGAQVIIVPPRVSELGFATVLQPEDLIQVLRQHGDVGGVIISTPSYEGAVAALPELVAIAHGQGVRVMVDSSWGSELGLSSLLPGSALQAGADLVVASPHKTLSAPGQAAWIFLSHGSMIDPCVFGAAVREGLSTSKSSVLLVGLDFARRDTALYAERRIERSVRTVQEEEERFRRRGLEDLLVRWDGPHIGYRAVFDLRETGHTGYEVARLLRERHGIQVAQANIAFICAGFGVGADKSIRIVFRALERVVRRLPQRPRLAAVPLPPLRLQEVDFAGVPGSGVEVVKPREAVGRLAKYPVGGYPPGFCVLVPGAKIHTEDIDYLDEIMRRGAVRFGPPREVPPGHLAVIPE